MSILECQSWVADKMGQAISTTQQTSLGIVGETLLCAINGGLDGDSWGAVSLILQEQHHSNKTCIMDYCSSEQIVMIWKLQIAITSYNNS